MCETMLCIALLGQSNADGWTGATPVPNGPVIGALYNDGAPATHYGPTQVSVERALAAEDRLFLKRAVGSTSILDWTAPGGLLDAAIADAQALGITPTVLLWIQGEEDAKEDGAWATYGEELAALIARWDTEVGPLDLIVSPRLRGGTPQPRAYAVNNAVAALALEDPRIVLIDTSGLQKSGIHYRRSGNDGLAARIEPHL